MEAMRCLKRRLSDAVYRQLLTDSRNGHGEPEAGSGGHRGASTKSSAADLTRTSALRISHSPSPQNQHYPPDARQEPSPWSR